jgi:hypothetical protein
MKLLQKIRYVFIGALGMTAAIPLILKATDAVPLTFRQGDILSAEILNTLFGRLNDVTLGFQSVDDLEGSWSCVTAESSGSCTGGSWGASIPFALDTTTGTTGFYKATSTMVFTKVAASETQISSTILIGGCGAYVTGTPFSGPYVYTGVMPFSNDLLTQKVTAAILRVPARISFQKTSPTQMKFTADAGGGTAVTQCTKTNVPPTPPTTLVATLSGSSVSLTWDDQSTDETGFKVQTKNSVGGSWVTLTTTPADVQSYTAVAATGNNWYRVLATNANGDSITSNEILVER